MESNALQCDTSLKTNDSFFPNKQLCIVYCCTHIYLNRLELWLNIDSPKVTCGGLRNLKRRHKFQQRANLSKMKHS